VTTARTRLLALLGRPVSHSRSPAMMTGALAELGLADAYSYLAFDVAPEALAAVVRSLADLGCAGANVTIPHKRAVLPLCVSVDDDARRIGAANVLCAVAGGFSAHNTDAPGAARALADAGVPLAGADVLLIGAGGAARAVAVGLAREGARAITVLARDLASAAEVLRACDGLGLRGATAVSFADDLEALRAHRRADILVQCTPLGSAGRIHDPAEDAYGAMLRWLREVRPERAAMDLVYAPARTRWLDAAADARARPVDGLGMLAHQGALALSRWCGVTARPAVLRRFLDAAATDG
jgi:shikimate dehydrogenase